MFTYLLITIFIFVGKILKMNDKKVRVRFAPSPTGPLHIGGVRTALYNYLFARRNNGDFILRIEDTDQTRYVPGAEEYIIESLKWCGIKIDEGATVGGLFGPYKQSERKDIYKKYAEQLVKSGHAYYAFDTPEELEIMRKNQEVEKTSFTGYNHQSRKLMKNSLTLSDEETQKLIQSGKNYVIRFKIIENQEVEFNDIIRENVKVNTSTLDDKVLFKADGLPTYHLANIVDDYLMKISHVIRGEEWLPSTPLHVLLYSAFGWNKEMPRFAHLPLILKPSGQGKLSKRDGDKLGFPVFPIEWKAENGEISAGYREDGYFPEAFINMLALLGWNPGTEQEIFSIDELIQAFSIEKVQKAGARFDPEKAKWFNHHYIQQKTNSELALEFKKELKNRNVECNNEKIEKIVGLVKERIIFIADLWEQSSFFFEAPTEFDTKAVKKRWKESSPELMKSVIEILKTVEPFNSINAEEAVKKYIEKNELGMGAVMNALRLCLVGKLKGPHLFDIIEIIGLEETQNRINYAINTIVK